MHSMSREGNLPRVLGKTNRQGTPLVAKLVVGTFNLVLISMGTPAAILAASAIGYTCPNGISEESPGLREPGTALQGP
jgi:amino acid transporter